MWHLILHIDNIIYKNSQSRLNEIEAPSFLFFAKPKYKNDMKNFVTNNHEFYWLINKLKIKASFWNAKIK